MANYVVGDIQGCFEEFKNGLELIKFESSKDYLWITGDLINRGPDSLKVLEYVIKIALSSYNQPLCLFKHLRMSHICRHSSSNLFLCMIVMFMYAI